MKNVCTFDATAQNTNDNIYGLFESKAEHLSDKCSDGRPNDRSGNEPFALITPLSLEALCFLKVPEAQA